MGTSRAGLVVDRCRAINSGQPRHNLHDVRDQLLLQAS